MSLPCWRTALPRRPSSARAARRLLERALVEGGVADAPQAPLAELLVSEVATNAIRYGSGEDFVVALAITGAVLRADVTDHSTAVPRARRAAPTEEGGRGLELVEMLSSAWGHRVVPEGKVVWFSLDLRAAG